ncbi:hypothetical protein JMF89_07025 [Clostridiaceae bacterium UIB06]|uniref:Uncharacterized protein n=1 Tax=Clostridium thailandense TaxID=2794346 RepID=A0A949TXR4_9CLOT|nr:hypothetical protein [Clostridium thailandense]MBV7272429.1 hypothetical protein [Clostridium thailandense]MCH5136953.1 hypothetical protein [Clostridiaceae bacterium UIB06]
MSTEKYLNEDIIEEELNEETIEEKLEENELGQITGGMTIGAISGSNPYNNYRYNRQANPRETNQDGALAGLVDSKVGLLPRRSEQVRKNDSKNTNRVGATSSISENDSNNQSKGKRFSGWG